MKILVLESNGNIRGCGTPSMTRASIYLEKAYKLGKSL